MFDICFFEIIHDIELKQDITNIAIECNNEFIPPLLTRKSTYQKTFTAEQYAFGDYLKTLIKQPFILVFDNNCLTGFMSFIHNYTCGELLWANPSNYITTVCVKNAYRKKGILNSMYQYICYNLPDKYKLDYISTRTWSTNYVNIHTLEKNYFERINVIRNDRGIGIDTIYYTRKY